MVATKGPRPSAHYTLHGHYREKGYLYESFACRPYLLNVLQEFMGILVQTIN